MNNKWFCVTAGTNLQQVTVHVFQLPICSKSRYMFFN